MRPTSKHELPRVVTGIKPTGSPHLGNYFGMMERVISMQDNYRVFCFVADYHALTTERDAWAVQYNVIEVVAAFMAMGLKPAALGGNVVLFRQSAVPEVHELAWYLSCVTGMGTLFRGHAYKAAEAKGEGGRMNVGTFTYPVLMAADILLYQADFVPVGEDQHQHVQMAQEMARHLNGAYQDELLREPEAMISMLPTVLGSDGRKMSKSYKNHLALMADPPQVRSFIKSIKTDSAALEAPKDPDQCIVARLHRLIAPASEADAMDAKYRAGGFGYGHAKEALQRAHEARFGAAHDEYRRLFMDPAYIAEVLDHGDEIARAEAKQTLVTLRDVTGITPRRKA